MSKKIALITGVTGQDGAYLSRFLLKKNYEVHGIKRRSSSFNTGRLENIYVDPHEQKPNFMLHYGDLTDASNLIRIIQKIKPNEIYNLGAQSHVQVSFETPEYTANSDALGTVRVLEAIRTLNMIDKVRFYQASTSEMFGKSPPPQNENTVFQPRSPYAAAKLFSYWLTVNYREAYGLFASNGILFNHESPMRGETFVTRKITRAVAAIHKGKQQKLWLGNLDARRDWGHAKDYIFISFLIVSSSIYFWPEDYSLPSNIKGTLLDAPVVRGKIFETSLYSLNSLKDLLVGNGWGLVPDLLLENMNPWQYDELRQGYNLHFHTHNEIAEHLVSVGLVGSLLFIIYIYFIFKFSGELNFHTKLGWLLFYNVYYFFANY